MKYTINIIDSTEEEEIILNLHKVDGELLNHLEELHSPRQEIFAHLNEHIHRVKLSNIFYFESIDNRVFVYTKKDVLEMKKKLYQLEDEFQMNQNIIRISKSMIINLDKLVSVSPIIGGRMEGHLENGERIIISRNYVKNLKQALGLENE